MKVDKSPFVLTIMASVILVVFTVTESNCQVVNLSPELQNYIHEALVNSNDLQSWTERVDAAEQRIPQAGAWNDPTLMLGLMNLPASSFDFNQEPMTGAWVNLAQSIPLTSRYSIQRDIANEQADKSRTDLQGRELLIARQLGELWYDWSYLRASVSTLDSSIAVLDDFLQIARRKYETGSGLQQDLFRIETERARLLDRRTAISQLETTAGERFAILLGREPQDVPVPPESFTGNFASIDGANLDTLLMTNNPTLESIRTNLVISNRQVDLKRSLWWPNLNLTAGYGYRQEADNGMSRPDFFSVTAGLSIPIFGSAKQGAAVNEARAIARQMQSDYDENVLQYRFNLRSLVSEDSRVENQIHIYLNQVIPQAESTLSASTSTYSVGKTDIEALLMAEMSLFNARLELLDRYRNRAKVRIKIASLVGSDELLIDNE